MNPAAAYMQHPGAIHQYDGTYDGDKDDLVSTLPPPQPLSFFTQDDLALPTRKASTRGRDRLASSQRQRRASSLPSIHNSNCGHSSIGAILTPRIPQYDGDNDKDNDPKVSQLRQGCEFVWFNVYRTYIIKILILNKNYRTMTLDQTWMTMKIMMKKLDWTILFYVCLIKLPASRTSGSVVSRMV